LYPDPKKRDELFLVVGEVHDPRRPGPSQTPHWLTIPERGLFTGTVILGAVGSGKTATAMYPFAEQILAFKASDKERKIGALVLEVKGDFCRKVKEILDRHDRGEDFIEISLDSAYRYNPLQSGSSPITQRFWSCRGSFGRAFLAAREISSSICCVITLKK
jgi:hypothetical protein